MDTERETEGQQWGVSCWNIWLGSKFKSLFVKKKRISGLSKSYNPKLNSRVLSPLLKKYLMDNQKNSPPWEMRSNRWNQNFFFCPGGGRENRCEFQIIHTNSDGHALLSRFLPPHVRAREREGRYLYAPSHVNRISCLHLCIIGFSTTWPWHPPWLSRIVFPSCAPFTRAPTRRHRRYTKVVKQSEVIPLPCM